MRWAWAVCWDGVILDEAQAIKNPASAQTRAFKKLTARTRVALTGTPIENDLTNLWFLFDFLDKGLLGTSREFKAFSKGISDHPERYADYASRIDRGKRYVRSGSVIDLNIRKDEIRAMVQGTRRTPYRVSISIAPLPEERCQTITECCGRKTETLEKLLSGDFPEEMQEFFLAKGGLFPSPEEIQFDCSCPDWANMCKHIAAAVCLTSFSVSRPADGRRYAQSAPAG